MWKKKGKLYLSREQTIKNTQTPPPPPKNLIQNPKRDTNTLLKYKIHTIFSSIEFLQFSVQGMDKRKPKPCQAEVSHAI